MIDNIPEDFSSLTKERLLKLLGIYAGEVLVHYGIWFTEAVANRGPGIALESEWDALEKYGPIALKRLAGHLGVEMEGNVPKPLADKSRQELFAMAQDFAKTWLASDGVWFQEIEGRSGMPEAKVVNDACWSVFAPMEAYKLRRLLGLDSAPSIEALEKTLKLRLYSTINAAEAVVESETTLVWRMKECRVQTARRRKGLENYPCKSAGIAEYTSFSLGIDERFATECLYCPPDRPPEGSICAWRFTLV